MRPAAGRSGMEVREMSEERSYSRPRLQKLLSSMGFDASDGGGDFSEMTGAQLRRLVDAGFVSLDDHAYPGIEVSYFLSVMEEVNGVEACGYFDFDDAGCSLGIDSLELQSTDLRKQVEFLRATRGADEIYDLESGGIGAWWD